MTAYKVYRYTFPDGKMYIGMTKHSIQNRRNCGYGHNKPLKDAVKKYGWASVTEEILEDGLAQDEAFEREKYYIESLKTNDPNIGYNVSAGGKNTFEGLHHTEEHRRKMSELYKGKVYSQETLRRMRNAHANERKPVICIRNGKCTSYGSLSEAASAVCGYKSNISRACRNGKRYKDCVWVMKGGDDR